MDSTTMIQVVSGVLFALVVGILIQRRRLIAKYPATGTQKF
jgi:hypothetical protein